MAKIRNVTLPEDYNRHLCNLLNQIPDFALVELGKEFLPGGFKHVDNIRERLRAKILGPGTLEIWLMPLLAQVAPGSRVVSTLSADGLREAFEPLVDALGGRNLVITAMLLDERDDVHRFGAEQLARGITCEPPEERKKEATRQLCDFLKNCFTNEIGRAHV